MSKLSLILATAVALFLFGCYHATILTGAKSSTEVIEESFASSWIYGLVPPSTIDAQAKCPNGVAKVETQLSFLNQLVGFLTLGIYTPMEIKVTCAEKSSSSLRYKGPDIVLHRGATHEEIIQAFKDAADMAVAQHRPVYVDY